MTAGVVVAVAICLLMLVDGIVAAAETVITRLGVVEALRLEENGVAGSSALLDLVEHPRRPLTVVLLVAVIVRISAAAVLITAVVNAGSWAVAAATVGLVVASFVLAEVAPRSLALRNLRAVGLRLAPPFALLTRVLHPVVRPLSGLGELLAGLSKGTGGDERAVAATADERLQHVLGDDEGDEIEIEADERAMIHSIFELGETVCREIMVPRVDMVTVDVDDDLTDVIDVTVTCGYSRIPVTTGDSGDIVGIVYAKDLLERLHTGMDHPKGRDWDDLVREPTFVPEFKHADDLLRDLRRQKVHLAIVVDEYGAVAGLVTIEDILEEIVGEILDEYDTEDPPVVRLGDHRLRLSGRVTVRDLNDLLEVGLPEDEGWDTVGGLVVGLLGYVPDAGEAVDAEGVTFVAERVQGRRVSRVLVTASDREQAPVDVDRRIDSIVDPSSGSAVGGRFTDREPQPAPRPGAHAHEEQMP